MISLLQFVARLLPPDVRDDIVGDIAERYEARRESHNWFANLIWMLHESAAIPISVITGAYRSTMNAPRETYFIMRELRFAFRYLLRNPLYTGSIVIVLGAALGVGTAAFSVTDALVLRGLPFDRAEELVFVSETYTPPDGGTEELRAASYPDFVDWKEGTDAFQHLAIFGGERVPLRTGSGDRPSIGSIQFLHPSMFGALGVSPAIGRLILPDDAESRVAVISHDFWTNQMGSQPDVVGSTVFANNVALEIVGVAEQGFGGLGGEIDVWAPFRAHGVVNPERSRDRQDNRGFRGYGVIGRLAPGQTIQTAQEQLERVVAGLHEEGLVPPERSVRVRDFTEVMIGDAADTARILFASILLVLIVSSSNVTSLMTARSLSRGTENSLKRALGASNATIYRQLLAESTVIALLSGAVGVGIALLASDVFAAGLTDNVPGYINLSLGVRSIVFAGLAAFAVAIISTLLPAAVMTSADGAAVISGSTRGGAESHSRGWKGMLRNSLVGGQVAITVSLMISAGLLVRSLQRQLAIDPGFSGLNTTLAEINLPESTYPDAESRALFATRMLDALRAKPQIESASLSTDVPLLGGYSATNLSVETNAGPIDIRAYRHAVSPGFFETLGIPVLAGRGIEVQDDASAEPVTVVSERLAQRAWPDENPIGKTVSGFRVIGVVPDIRYRTLVADAVDAPNDPDFYYPIAQTAPRSLVIAATPSAVGADVRGALQAALDEVDSGLPLFGETTMAELVDYQVANSRAAAEVISIFAVLALILSAAGLYGVQSFIVSRRTRDIGVMMALGCDRRRVLSITLGKGMVTVAIGVLVGLAGALALAPMLKDQMYETSSTDPSVLGPVTLAVLVTALAAAWLPARRATRIDPVLALRQDT